MRTKSALWLARRGAVGVLLAHAGCSARTHEQRATADALARDASPVRAIVAVAVDAHTDVPHDAAHTHEVGTGAAVADETGPPDPTDGACTREATLRVEPGWTSVGYHLGPTLRDVVGLRRGTWLGVTSRRVCTSDDQGEHWQERLRASAPLALRALDDDGAYLVFERTRDAQRGPSAGRAWVSLDGEGAHWIALALPAALGAAPVYAYTSDGRGRLFVASATQLFSIEVSALARAHARDEPGDLPWQGPVVLPGREARDLQACGPGLLLARARVDDEWFFQRSYDRGQTWRPLRTGVFGVEAPSALVRCRDPQGGIEGGRSIVPSHESDDGGRTWRRSDRYDATAQRAVRGESTTALAPEDVPRCGPAPGAVVACTDAGRLRFLGGAAQEIHAPGRCARVRPLDDRRLLAFGAACGVLFSADRGGRWRQVSLANEPAGAANSATPLTMNANAGSGGRGGFVDARTVWRVDEGLWSSNDGGARWSPVPSSHARALTFGTFVDAQRGVFATRDGLVLATRDGGHTFTFVLQGDVQRIASAAQTVVVTTSSAVRVSRDGGARWALPHVNPVPGTLDPALEMQGAMRIVRFASGASVLQRGAAIVVHTTHDAAPRDETIVRELPREHALLAAWAGPRGEPQRVLLEGGIVLARDGSARR